MLLNETICAVASAGGSCAVSIVRLCGIDALQIASELTKKQTPDFTPRYAHLCTVYAQDENPIDQAIVIYFAAPKSFNGENIVEIQCHGGFFLASLILNRCLALGARQAWAGEFTRLAVQNSKIDIAQAEAISALIAARSEAAVKCLARQLRGSLGALVESARTKIIEAMAFAETAIDYADDDLPDNLLLSIKDKLSVLLCELQNISQASHARSGIFEGFKVGLVGKPNAGKSSILNAMLRYDRAIVSDMPGTTRDTVEESIHIGSHLIRLVDTAGIRQTAHEIEQIGIERTLIVSQEAQIILAVFDLSREFDEDDATMLYILTKKNPKSVIALLNKCDLLQKFDESRLPQGWSKVRCDRESAARVISESIEELLNTDADADTEIASNARQLQAIEDCAAAVSQSLQPLLSGELEIFSFHLREAASHIGALTRPYDNEETLDAMFSSFCLGK